MKGSISSDIKDLLAQMKRSIKLSGTGSEDIKKIFNDLPNIIAGFQKTINKALKKQKLLPPVINV